MPAQDRGFLRSILEDREDLTKVASDETPENKDEKVDQEAQNKLYDEAYNLIVKEASEAAAEQGKEFDPKSLTEAQLNDLMPDAVAMVLEKRAAVAEVGEDQIAAASDAFQMAIEYGEFMGGKMHRAQTGFLAKTAGLLKRAAHDPKVSAKDIISRYLEKVAETPAGTAVDAAGAAVKKTVKRKMPGHAATDIVHVMKKAPMGKVLGGAAALGTGAAVVGSMIHGRR